MKNKSVSNPFIVSGFVSKKYFCDRETELDHLLDNVSNGRNVVLYSWRRMGKTSLIRCFFSQLERTNKAETLYIDLMPSRNMEEAIQAIARAIHNKYKRTTRGLSENLVRMLAQLGFSISFDPMSGYPKVEVGLNQLAPPEHSLQALGQFLAKRKKQVVIAIDEFQQITHYPDVSAEAVFRGWMQSFPQLRLIFSGSHRKMMQSMFSEQNRPFYKSTQLLDLKPISSENYGRFIQKHFLANGMVIEKHHTKDIYLWSRGQTYTIQLVCNKLFGMRRDVTDTSLKQVYDEIIEQEKHVFFHYSKLLTNTQWAVLKAVAQSEPLTQPQSQEFISRYRLGAASTVATALKMLTDKELVVQEDDHYFVHDVLLARWLQKTG